MSDCCAYYQNRACEYFPCHEKADAENFSCLFCWCPLYTLGERCGGSFRYTEEGVKDCSACLLPHRREGYEYIKSRFGDLSRLAAKQENGI